MAIQMTRQEYEQKYGLAPVLPKSSNIDTTPAPRRMTRAEYDAEFNKGKEKKDNKYIDTSFGSAGRTISSSFQSGVGQIKEGFSEAASGRNPLETGAKLGSGVVGAAFSPLSPVFKPIMGGVEAISDKISDIPSVQKFAGTKAGKATERAAEFVSNVTNIADAVLGAKGSPEGVGYAKKKAADLSLERKATKEIKVQDKISKQIYNIENNYSKLRTANEYSKDSGAASRNRIAQTDVLLREGVVDSDGKISTKQPGGAVEQYIKQTIDGKESVVRDNLAKNKETVNLAQVGNALQIELFKSGLEGSDLVSALSGVAKELKGLKLRADEFNNIPLEIIHDAKINTTKNINFQTPPETATYRKAVARTYKTLVEDNSKKFDVKPVNVELGKYLEDVERLEALDGRKVKGGKLGKYFAQISGNMIGAGVGGAVGGPLGMGIGTVVGGEAGSFMRGKAMKETFPGERGAVAPKNAILEKAMADAKLEGKVDLTKADKRVGAVKGVPKTKEVMRLEKDIARNVDAQKKAIKAGDFTLVSKLKEVYTALVEKLKELVKAAKENIKDQKGFIKNPLGQNASPKAKGKGELLSKSQELVPSQDATTHLQKAQEFLREAKGMSADDIMKKNPDIQLKRDVVVRDIHGNKSVVPEGEVLTPYELKGNKVLLQDGETYIVSKSQAQTVMQNAKSGEARPFAPELKGTEETVRGNAIKNKEIVEYNIVDKETGRTHTYSSMEFAEKAIKEHYPNGKIEVKKYKKDVLSAEDKTKHSSYQLPDGKNYKEVLIKAPNADNIKASKQLNDKAFADFDAGKITEAERNKILDSNNHMGNNFKSSHWDEPNVISHLRLNERTYKGKRVTFMEELQSDWAREGRSKGFENKDAQKQFNDYSRELRSKYEGVEGLNELPTFRKIITPAEHTKFNELQQLSKGDIPNHPLLKNWQTPTVKRALQEAVANDSEYFSWINGEQTSARYNLATRVDSVKWEIDDSSFERKANGGKNVIIKPKDGKSEFNILIDKDGKITSSIHRDWEGKKLDEALGKGLADKIMADETGTLTGAGLKFGGEWANTLYDKQVGNIIKDLTGAKVEVMDLGLPIEKAGHSWKINDINSKNETTLTPKNIKVGQTVYDRGTTGKLDNYIITDILGDGKFKAVEKSHMDWLDQHKGSVDLTETDKQTFDISTKTTTQQGIRLTPEIKAKIRGEAPTLKKPSGVLKLK